MTATEPEIPELDSPAPAQRTLWGLAPSELHDRYWAAHGIQVVRPGQPSQIVDRAELYLLTASHALVLFSATRLVERLYWSNANVITVRVHSRHRRRYVERIVTDAQDNFLRFDRQYVNHDQRAGCILFTPDRAVADAWQGSGDARRGARVIRGMIARSDRLVDRISSDVYDVRSPEELLGFMKKLSKIWARPDATVDHCRPQGGRLWLGPQARIEDGASIDGPVWIGAGRHIAAEAQLFGPAVLWDDPNARPAVQDVRWQELEPTQLSYANAVRHARGRSWIGRKTKRLFDIGFAATALLLTSPIYIIIAIAVLFEDGWPFIFGHQRETRGGKQFRCLKFRSMRKDADELKQALLKENQADGPQFFIKDDPRLTGVGRFIRKFNIDELPQFYNVLVGEMSVVGPRPSPRHENQFCPPWREARLSVRPGITGLWQVMRTRLPGSDFQEWIRYDLEYVENMNLRLDLSIIRQTIGLLLKGKLK